uniref:Uncharacterized protein n=1 Tax=Rhizophora mucronata TaxID=61149 RepID=A0A2P2IKZ8_RHIMU
MQYKNDLYFGPSQMIPSRIPLMWDHNLVIAFCLTQNCWSFFGRCLLVSSF